MRSVVVVSDHDQVEEAWAIRTEVFVDEQHVPPEEEVDAADVAPSTTHVLVYDDDRAIATGRVLSDDAAHPGVVHVGRVAVRREARGSGAGALVMAHLEAVALERHGVVDGGRVMVRVELSAQEAAMGFYARLGYRTVGTQRYLDAGIWHQDMARSIVV